MRLLNFDDLANNIFLDVFAKRFLGGREVGKPLHAGLVTHQLCDCDVFLAVLSEFWPIFADFFVVVDQFALDEHRHHDGGHHLCVREDHLQRVSGVGLGLRFGETVIFVEASQIDNLQLSKK